MSLRREVRRVVRHGKWENLSPKPARGSCCDQTLREGMQPSRTEAEVQIHFLQSSTSPRRLGQRDRSCQECFRKLDVGAAVHRQKKCRFRVPCRQRRRQEKTAPNRSGVERGEIFPCSHLRSSWNHLWPDAEIPFSASCC